MKGQITQAFEERLAPLVKRIEKLEQRYDLTGITAIAERSAEEDGIQYQIHELMALAEQAGDAFLCTVQKKLQSLILRLALAPSAPRIELILLVQNILALNPLILVTDDAVNEAQEPELTRIFSMELTTVPRFDCQFPLFSDENIGLQGTALKKANMASHAQGTSIEREWTRLQSIHRGRFVVAFDFPLVQLQLAITARRNGLLAPMLIGHSLQDLLLQYVRINDPIGKTFEQNTPIQASQVLANEDIKPFIDCSVPADQRAHHLLHALQAIGNGTLSLQEPLQALPGMPFANSLLIDPFKEQEN